MGQIAAARAHGLWTYEPRQGRKAATVVCSASAVVTLALLIYDLRLAIYELAVARKLNIAANRISDIVYLKWLIRSLLASIARNASRT